MTTPTAPIPTIHNLKAGLTLLAANLVLATRTDGTEYRMLREDCPIHDDLQTIVRDAHNGELPNDWRFSMIYDLCHAFLDYSQPDSRPWALEDYLDVAGEIAELQTDHACSRALSWLADNVTRCHFDQPEIYCADADSSNIADLAQRRQREEIEWMAHSILSGVEALVSA